MLFGLIIGVALGSCISIILLVLVKDLSVPSKYDGLLKYKQGSTEQDCQFTIKQQALND